MSVEHDSFSVRREYPHPPAQVFAAWADPARKLRWFDLSGGPAPDYRCDFRVGGDETLRTSGLAYRATYRDIVQDERIVYTYEVVAQERLASVSVASVQLRPTPGGTELTYVESAAFLDGLDDADTRTRGTGTQLHRLATVLEEER
ncbi:MAG: SRPBCC domain-containing protein [Solirubrobacterales bacterium]|nr:SRPBCC domain-containing protein [Solirubrobacterales bacterium]